MAFTSLSNTLIQVGKAVKKEIFQVVKDNFDDHETRLNSVEFQQAANFIFNGDISLFGFDSNNPDVYYYKAPTNFSLSDVEGQLFTKQSIVTGALSVDIQKSINTNDVNFSSCLTSDLSFNFATDPNYTSKQATIDGSNSTFITDDVLRIVITSIPEGFTGRILLRLGAS
jgi:hypothetical protein